MDLSIFRGSTEPPLLHLTLGELVRDQAKTNGSRIAVASQHQDQSLSSAELEKRTDILASSLSQLGVKRGDRVAILLGNRIEYVEVRKKYPIIHSSSLLTPSLCRISSQARRLVQLPHF